MSAPGLAGLDSPESTPADASRNAGLLWFGQLVSATGDALFLPCVAWMAGRAAGDAQALMVGVTVALATVPYLLFGPLAGALVDRFDRRRIMVVSDLLRAALLLAFTARAIQSGGATPAELLVVAFLLGTFSTPFAPARDALLPDLVGTSALTRWNAVVQTSAQLAMIVGLALGALVLGGAGGGAAEEGRVRALLAWDGISFLLSAVALLLLRLPARARGPRSALGLWRTLAAGLRYARGDRVVRGLLLLTALDNLAIMGPAIVGATLLVQQTFALGPEALAAFEGAMAVGMLAGSLLIAVLGRRVALAPLLLMGMTLDGLTYLPFAWIEHFPLGLLAIAFHGLCIPAIVVSRTSLLHRHVPAGRRGQVFALVGMTVAGMTALSALASGWVAEASSPRVLFLAAGVLGSLCGVLGFLAYGRLLSGVERRAAGPGAGGHQPGSRPAP